MNVFGLHFIRPEWLWLLPLHIVLVLILMRSSGVTPWAAHLPKAALDVLSIGRFRARRFARYWFAIAGLCLIIATAGPSWITQSTPALNNPNATVVLLDLSPSMLSKDVLPDRITRARYELIDLLDHQKDGQVGLIAYAGSAHIVSPLTDDSETIKSLVPALSPTVIPERGSNVEAAVTLAQRLLSDAGVSSGNLILITDGVNPSASEEIVRLLKRAHTLSILGIGGDKLAPIPELDGGFLKDVSGEIVLTKLEFTALKDLASATGGRATRLFPDARDTQLLTKDEISGLSSSAQANPTPENNDYDQWQDMGYLLILLALPIVLLLFRKGAVYGLVIFMLAPMPFEPAQAESNSRLSRLFKTNNQRGAALMQEGKHAEAAETFENQEWSAVANYKAKNYDATVTDLDGKADTTSLYNKANAQALSGDLEAAIETYNDVLKQEPDHEDAGHNKALLEQLKQQQDQQQQDQQNPDQSQDGEQNQEQNQNGEQGQDQQQDQQQNGSESNNEQQSQDQESDQNKSSSDNAQQQKDSSSPPQDDTNSLSEQSEQQANSNEPSEDQADQKHTEQTPQSQDQSEDQADKDEPSQDTSVAQPQANEENAPEQQLGTDQDPAVQQLVADEDTQSLSDSSEQWLRSIGEDPSGLLRRKFEYQARQSERQRQSQQRNGKPNTAKEQRY